MRAKIVAAGNGSSWSKQMDLFMEMLLELGETPTDILGNAIYPAAGMVAHAIRRGIHNLPSLHREAGNLIAGVGRRQRQGFLDGLGISKMEHQKGGYNVKIGFAGYNDVRTAKFPNGQPNVLVARCVESGSSVINKTPFVRPAVRRVREQAVKEMEKSLDHSFAEIQKKYERGR